MRKVAAYIFGFAGPRKKELEAKEQAKAKI
jgi:hypothetical protein